MLAPAIANARYYGEIANEHVSKKAEPSKEITEIM